VSTATGVAAAISTTAVSTTAISATITPTIAAFSVGLRLLDLDRKHIEGERLQADGKA
jgi:hypothetical protein